ncbi:SpoIIE family protein phosphatase [Streptomyces sp. NPDC052012]|uniref:SpoIIE family protein phosphatase n=1 Tax=Streptomyces sp. NPDC052012 TaxID=3155051 RepID=UPI00344CFCE8
MRDALQDPVLSRALAAALLSRAGADMAVLDDHLRITWAYRAPGGTAVDGVGRRFDEVYRLDDSEAFERFVRSVRSGHEPGRLRLKGHPDGQETSARSLLLTAHRLHDACDEPLGVLLVVKDETQAARARRRAAVPAAVREAVGKTLDLTATARDLVACLVPGYAHIATVDIVDDVLNGQEPPPAAAAEASPMRRAAVRSTVTLAAQAAAGPRLSAPRTPFARTLADLRPRLVDLDPALSWPDLDPRWTRAVREAGAHSLLIAPLALHGAVLGLLTLYRCAGDDPFAAADLDTAADVAAHAALCMDNARRYARDHTIAATVQRRLLPQWSGARAGLETAHVHRTGAGQSCWYDVIDLPGARTALVVGSVAGDGIDSAATMGQLRMVIRSLAELDAAPDELLARLNECALRLAEERAALPPGDPLHREPLTATCAYAVYDPSTRHCAIASAGHASPLVLSPEGTLHEPDVVPGPELGSADPEPVTCTGFTVEEGSVLAFRGGGFLPPPGPADAALRRALAGASRDLTEVSDAMVYALPDPAVGDGAVLLLCRTLSLPADHVTCVELPQDGTSASAARAVIRERCAAWHIDDDTAQAAELIGSELVTNAIRYGAPPIRLRLILSDALTCEVSDTGRAAPRLRHARTMDESGRGLYIVARFAPRWGVRYTEAGKVLWTEQSLDPPAPALAGHGAP